MVKVNRYVGKTAREALAAVKAELGPDAVVLSNRAVDGGVEIVAIPSDQMGELTATVREAREVKPAPVQRPAPAVRPATPAAADEDDFTVTLGQHIARMARETQQSLPARARPTPQFEQRLDARPAQEAAGSQMNVRAFNPPRVLPNGEPYPQEPAQVAAPQVRKPESSRLAMPVAQIERDAQIQALENSNARLADELGSIKGMLERQLAGFAWSEISRNAPARTQMMSELLEAGFSAQLARSLTDELAGDLTPADARSAVKNRLDRQLKLVDSDADIIERGGVYALVGPTGVGKTTTAAKLAARCVVRHGADKLALITTDGYRIGAHEQLRIYGRILGVTVHVVRDAADLRQTLQDLRNKHMVLIDTVGMSQRDRMVLEQSSMLTAAGVVRRLLVLNATARGDTLDDVVRAYDGPDLAGCILSKVDEAASLAPVLDVALRRELQVFYVANGQRVPEDLHLPNRTYLIHRALREVGADSAFKLDSAEACMLMAGQQTGARTAMRGAR
ncbi:flagellar biosynthesis protein FlhF [Uliginosibacterium sp. 31-16]|uniref:flagellar biosynthesis protein FlhF n=1 Tax=Uliginosibacterium sp. 31-16 TaxID=3068315 RepID=UPI00273F3C4C|nr:flagellar biosynthesis protein FlhF [Uliginosibacterium sp. 31-16]MDP5240583.1 flagellar biosynthesis protein FlhF [Uliginosibacterium sp. 31-16]